MNDIMRFYDLTAEDTANEWYNTETLLPTITDFISFLPEKPCVLDLGCGPGYESMRLSKLGANITGVDFSTESIRIARERCKECRFEVLDFRELDGRFGTFDGVFASGSLIHIEPNLFENVVTRVNTVLNRNGIFLFVIREGEGFIEAWPEIDGVKLHRVIYKYPADYILAILKKCGFEYIRDSVLDGSFVEYGWRGYLFKKI